MMMRRHAIATLFRPLGHHRQYAGAADRNKGPILEMLHKFLARIDGIGLRMLEIGSGTGQHAAHMAAAMPDVEWQTSDYETGNFPSIKAWNRDVDNVLAPIELDASAAASKADAWGLEGGSFDCMIAVNVIHISPWAVSQGLFAGGGFVLREGGLLFTYGPYLIDGKATTESNAAFDASLRHRNAEWGIRDATDCRIEAAKHGMELIAAETMPSNNFLLVWRRTVAAAPVDLSASVGAVPGLAGGDRSATSSRC